MSCIPLEILIATLNQGKIIEIKTALSNLPVTFHYLSEYQQIFEPIEDGSTYAENGAIKAISYARQTGLAALADDSGLEVSVLNGEPGVLSARYAGAGATDKQRIEKLLAALKGKDDRSARFVCNIALAEFGSSAEEPIISIVTTGICTGTILREPRGSNGFGFDPVFVPNGYNESFAELPAQTKDRISHRGQALKAMRAELDQRPKH